MVVIWAAGVCNRVDKTGVWLVLRLDGQRCIGGLLGTALHGSRAGLSA